MALDPKLIDEAVPVLSRLGGISENPEPPFSGLREWSEALGDGGWSAKAAPGGWEVEVPVTKAGVFDVIAGGLTEDVAHLLALARALLPDLLSEREEMLAVLRAVEWEAQRDGDVTCCPVCGGYNPRDPAAPAKRGHAPDCRLDALLNGDR